MFRVERHELGPRLFVLGRRVHECHAGIVLAVVAGLNLFAGWPLPGPFAIALLALGTWFLWKDWHDLFPRLRDTTAWSTGVHRTPTPLRSRGRIPGLAALAGVATVAMGLVNVASALTPSVHSRMHVLLQLVPREVPVAAHALALSTGISLTILGVYLMRRRRHAWALAVAILSVAGLLNVFKGLDIEEALANWGLAALLVWGRDAFHVLHRDSGWRAPLVRSLTVVAGVLATTVLTLVAASHWGTPGLNPARAVSELAACLTLSAAPIHYRDPFDWVPAGIDLLWMGAALSVAWLAFRPLAAPRGLPDPKLRPLAREIVERHGTDTLSFFKLRADKHHFFDSTGRAFLGYRIEAGVLLVSGDPIGPRAALPGLVRELCGFAEARGLAIGVVGASEEFAELAAGAGLRSFYIGDEAIVELRAFSLEGRPIRKVRQAVTRARKAGFTAALLRVDELSEAELSELEELSDRWRGDEPERGFSMAIDDLYVEGTLFALAEDAEGRVGGFLHLVPAPAGGGWSLSTMRRRPHAPNGLTEFLIAETLAWAKEQDASELSLNFCAFTDVLSRERATTWWKRLARRALLLADNVFQLERLYAFNRKFFPEWRPRYICVEQLSDLPAVGLAYLHVEGLLVPPGPWARRGERSATPAK